MRIALMTAVALLAGCVAERSPDVPQILGAVPPDGDRFVAPENSEATVWLDLPDTGGRSAVYAATVEVVDAEGRSVQGAFSSDVTDGQTRGRQLFLSLLFEEPLEAGGRYQTVVEVAEQQFRAADWRVDPLGLPVPQPESALASTEVVWFTGRLPRSQTQTVAFWAGTILEPVSRSCGGLACDVLAAAPLRRLGWSQDACVPTRLGSEGSPTFESRWTNPTLQITDLVVPGKFETEFAPDGLEVLMRIPQLAITFRPDPDDPPFVEYGDVFVQFDNSQNQVGLEPCWSSFSDCVPCPGSESDECFVLDSTETELVMLESSAAITSVSCEQIALQVGCADVSACE